MTALVSIILIFGVLLGAYRLQNQLKTIYENGQSSIIFDRNGKEIMMIPNKKGHYARFIQRAPERFVNLLVEKEDRFFYYHMGINPFSIGRELSRELISPERKGSSTITQQLVKLLLGNEGKRTLANKIKEAWYALSLELFHSKQAILAMYANTAYFGNQAQGIKEASRFYFNRDPNSLDDTQILELLATLNNPSQQYPGTSSNARRVKFLADALDVSLDQSKRLSQPSESRRKSDTAFELESQGIACQRDCKLTIDKDLTETLRDVLTRNIESPGFAGVKNGAIVVIKLPENELLAIVGSPNPNLEKDGYQINMATRPRAIGSTAKPFIYLTAFEKGARPYTLVEDKEYKYDIATGFAFYPKNYDGRYRGMVTLHQALSNSLNVPSVKVLEFAGIKNVYDFFTHSLSFIPFQPLENYELSLVLGGLEMDPLTLAHYFTLFPNQGVLKPLWLFSLGETDYLTPPMSGPLLQPKETAPRPFTQLINKILSDRDTGVDQFGAKSNLNLPAQNYAVKTGTSGNFHDSWTVGYTPDFLVTVWIGNADNKPMWQLSGQSGAGRIWHEAMEKLLNSPYNKKTPFDFGALQEFTQSGSIEYGLKNDDYARSRTLLLKESLIESPHERDVFVLENGMRIPLAATRDVEWFISNALIGKGTNVDWRPAKSGTYFITARDQKGAAESITIEVSPGN